MRCGDRRNACSFLQVAFICVQVISLPDQYLLQFHLRHRSYQKSVFSGDRRNAATMGSPVFNCVPNVLGWSFAGWPAYQQKHREGLVVPYLHYLLE